MSIHIYQMVADLALMYLSGKLVVFLLMQLKWMDTYPPSDSIARFEDGYLRAVLDQDVGASQAC